MNGLRIAVPRGALMGETLDLLDGLAEARMPRVALERVERVERRGDVERTIVDCAFALARGLLAERSLARPARTGRLRDG